MRAPARGGGVLVAAGALLTAAACGSSSHPAADGPTTIAVSVTSCGTGWSHPAAGQEHFLLANTDTRPGEVLLTDARTAAVYADVEPLGPGTTVDLDIALGSGSYVFHCAMEDESTVVGPTVTVPGHVRSPTRPVQPVTQADLIQATEQYQGYVRGRLPTLSRLTDALATAVDHGDLAGARAAWLPAHLEYERLGAAYGAFGDLDGAINGLPQGLPKGVDDPGWTGFHRIENGLWHGASAASLRGPTDRLRTDVAALGHEFADAQVDPLELSIRAHEITENALQFELTGETDFGSGSNLATVRANLDGTQTVLGILRPLLASRYRGLDRVMSDLTGAEHDLDGLDHGGRWTTLTGISRTDRGRVDADISQLSEELAPVASILEPRRNS